MKTMSSQELEARFGLKGEELDALERDAANGVFHGKPRGEIIVGRPLMFGEQMQQVGFKEPIGKVNAIDKRARQLGMRRSDYLRYLVDTDLKAAGIA